MIYSDTDRREIYCAPFLGNGEITLQIMPDGYCQWGRLPYFYH